MTIALWAGTFDPNSDVLTVKCHVKSAVDITVFFSRGLKTVVSKIRKAALAVFN